VTDERARLDATATAFFISQEGFVPAPFTPFTGVRALARGRLLRIKGGVVTTERYWEPKGSWEVGCTTASVRELSRVLEHATRLRMRQPTAVLLSGGTDSTLVLRLAAKHDPPPALAVTAAIEGFGLHQVDIGRARGVAGALRTPHSVITLTPDDDAIPDEWTLCTGRWMVGNRLAWPLWLRLAQHLATRLGKGFTALSGQMADTLADNNYTEQSWGYFFRRLAYSPWSLRAMPVLAACLPQAGAIGGRGLAALTARVLGPRAAAIVRSVLGGVHDRQAYYAGRVFGFAEFPGRSREQFPMLTDRGFEEVTAWYGTYFLAPVLERLEPRTFYRQMIELSMDMCMLHLDCRQNFHLFQLAGGAAELPFLDTRIVEFFCSLPPGARAWYRRPKQVIRSAVDDLNSAHAQVASLPEYRCPSVEEILLGGSLGRHLRRLLEYPRALDRAPGIFELLSEPYVDRAIRSFRRGEPTTDFRLVSRLAALEEWTRCPARD